MIHDDGEPPESDQEQEPVEIGIDPLLLNAAQYLDGLCAHHKNSLAGIAKVRHAKHFYEKQAAILGVSLENMINDFVTELRGNRGSAVPLDHDYLRRFLQDNLNNV